jgi:hypothetical protein
MKTITPQQLILLPLHDATIISVSFPDLNNGFDTIAFLVKINSEESLELFQELGCDKREVWLSFQGCPQISASLVGFCSGREVISSMDLIENSEIKGRLVQMTLAGSSSSHFRMTGSHGSQFDILAASVSLGSIDPA